MRKILFRYLLIIICITCFYPLNIFGQFSIISVTPSNGTANVDTATTLSITFSAAVDTNARFLYPGDFFINLFYTPDSLVHEPDSITFSPDMHTVYFHNLHLSVFTIYHFAILNAVSINGDSLDVPYSFTFATNPMIPYNATVSGTISFPGNEPAGAIVLLFDSNPFEMEESEIECWGVVSNSSGMYTIDYVDSGFYWIAALKGFYVDEDGDIQIRNGSKLGYFDFGNDYRPDSIFVFPGSNISGLDMSL